MYLLSYNCFSGARESAAKLTPVIKPQKCVLSSLQIIIGHI